MNKFLTHTFLFPLLNLFLCFWLSLSHSASPFCPSLFPSLPISLCIYLSLYILMCVCVCVQLSHNDGNKQLFSCVGVVMLIIFSYMPTFSFSNNDWMLIVKTWKYKLKDLVLISVLYSLSICILGTSGVMVIVVRNGQGDPSSKPRQDWLYFR